MKLETIAGISPNDAQRLRAAGIHSIDALFRAGITAEGRRGLAEKTGIADTRILSWVHQADLVMRIRGLGEDYGDLLGEAGVVTVEQLARHNPDHLHEKIVHLNRKARLVGRPPSRERVARWIEQAKTLPPAVS